MYKINGRAESVLLLRDANLLAGTVNCPGIFQRYNYKNIPEKELGLEVNT
jgi:hypothetical protein